jgi:cytochrome b subunit of formate dehydrogenase
MEYKVNGIVLLLSVVAIFLFIMVRNDAIKELFAAIVAPGIVVTYAEYVASNQGFRAASSSSCVAAVGSVMIIVLVVQGYFLNEEARAKYGKWAKAAGSVLMLFLTLNIFLLMYYRMTFVLAESEGISSLTAKIETGVSKGLVVTQEEYDNYMKIYSDTESIRSMPNDTKVVYMGDHILWMAGSQRAATCSVWRNSNIGDRKLFLYVYYDERPDMIADVIYVEEKYGYELVEELVEKYGYSAVKKSAGWILSR